MYHAIKSLIIRYFPGTISRFEFPIRKILAIFYGGNKVFCNVCERNLSHFIYHDTGDYICPACGSLGRHRRLWFVLQDAAKPVNEAFILHFSPSKIIQKKLKALHPNYTTTDYDGKLKVDKAHDITNIDAAYHSFDLIICYHVLEHIIEDSKAISELYRILRVGGMLMVQTPFKEGEIYEDFTIQSSEGRKKYFGQEDHVRIYSIQGLRNRLEDHGFLVEELFFEEKKGNYMGLKLKESILLCRKS